MQDLNGSSEVLMKSEIKFYCHPELKNVLVDLAIEANKNLSDFLVERLAKMVGRKELSKTPRKRMGRPITKATA